MARKIITISASGNTSVFPLAIAYLSDDGGDLEIVPFEREVSGVEFVDGTLMFRHDGFRWHRISVQ